MQWPIVIVEILHTCNIFTIFTVKHHQETTCIESKKSLKDPRSNMIPTMPTSSQNAISCNQWYVSMHYNVHYQFNINTISYNFPLRCAWLIQTTRSHPLVPHWSTIEYIFPPKIQILVLHALGFPKCPPWCTTILDHGSLVSHWDLIISWTTLGLL